MGATAGLSVGRGLSDITGEAADCGMMGYGKADQRSAGIHLRLRARAFVFAPASGSDGGTDSVAGDGGARLLLVVAELPLVFDSVRQEVLRRLAARFGGRYTDVNTMITCTHTHCGPGGYSHHALYNVTTGGFHHRTFAAIVDGIVEAVERADADVAPTELALAVGELHDASTNRSRSSFDLNPPEERAFFPDAVDPQTTLLAMSRGGRLVGAVNWFATHGTSMTNRNRLISSDNKGYAAYSWERLEHGVDYLAAGRPGFIGAFAQTNAGDMSPNLNRRPGSGPTENEFENTRIIGSRQQRAAAALAVDVAAGHGEPVGGPLDARLTHIDLTGFDVDAEFSGDGRPHRTSGPYAGAGQVAGTDEGKGFAGFRQGANPLFDGFSARVAYRVWPALRDSQAPKGIVLPRVANRVVPLIQERVPVQLLRIGPLYLIGLPAEITIVSGLRLRRAVAEVVGAPLTHVLVAGYSNGYIHYVTTPEEYDNQRYEGGSTMYGRWELPALVQTAVRLARAMRDGTAVERGTPPPDLAHRAGAPGVLPPDVPAGGAFGTVLRGPRAHHRAGDTVTVRFVGANPNHDQRRESTFLVVEREVAGGWERVADDGDWATRFHWSRSGSRSGSGSGSGWGSRLRGPRRASVVTIEWTIPDGTPAGRYRIDYRGDALWVDGRISAFAGVTNPFQVLPA